MNDLTSDKFTSFLKKKSLEDIAFTLGVTPADLLIAIMITKIFEPHSCAPFVQSLKGLEPGMECAAQCALQPSESCRLGRQNLNLLVIPQ